MRKKLTMNRLGLTLAGLTLLAMAFSGCSDVIGGTISVDSVSIFHGNQPAPATINLRIYSYGIPNSVQLEARVLPADADNQGVTWAGHRTTLT